MKLGARFLGQNDDKFKWEWSLFFVFLKWSLNGWKAPAKMDFETEIWECLQRCEFWILVTARPFFCFAHISEMQCFDDAAHQKARAVDLGLSTFGPWMPFFYLPSILRWLRLRFPAAALAESLGVLSYTCT